MRFYSTSGHFRVVDPESCRDFIRAQVQSGCLQLDKIPGPSDRIKIFRRHEWHRSNDKIKRHKKQSTMYMCMSSALRGIELHINYTPGMQLQQHASCLFSLQLLVQPHYQPEVTCTRPQEYSQPGTHKQAPPTWPVTKILKQRLVDQGVLA